MIEAKQVRYGIRSREILRGVDFRVEKGEFVGLIGPNGSGKSTFLKNVYKVLRPQAGELTLMGDDLLAMSNREMAQRLAVMVQEQEAAFDFTVEEVVMMGRQARKRLLETDSREDRALVGEILARTGLASLREELDDLTELRELIGRAIVDEPPFSVREGGFIRAGYHPEVDRLRDIMANGKGLVASIEAREKEKTGIKSLKVGYNKVFGYYIEVSKSYYDQVPDTYIRKQTLTNCERFITQELKELELSVLINVIESVKYGVPYRAELADLVGQ